MRTRLACGLILAGMLSHATVARADVLAERAALYEAYHAKLQELSAGATANDAADLALRVKNWAPVRDPAKLYLFVPETGGRKPDATNSDKAAGDKASDAETRFRKLRDEQADALFALARRAVKEQRASLAYELILETARENPDHKPARRMLGYINRDGWRTPFEINQLGAGKAWDEKFGWLPKAYLERYAAGQRNARGRWISAEEDERDHATIERGWRVDSEHYALTTNHSLEEGVSLSQKLERLYLFWQVVFPRFLASERDIAARIDGGKAKPRDPRRHKVVYFRARDEYSAALQRQQPRIAITLGIYFDREQTAYFFAGKEQIEATIFHEATHQLFHESRPATRDVAKSANFWVIEGVACYMETLTAEGDHYTLGGLDSGRIASAKQAVADGFYLPLRQLVGYNVERLQQDPDIARLYSQATGLTAFLMHSSGGRYREALTSYLEAIYSGVDDVRTLAKLTGRSYEELDAEYKKFMSD